MTDRVRKLAAEALGTAILVATVVGSGIMAQRLTNDIALALLGNTIATGAILVVLIGILGPLSGAHFNPAVTLVMALRRQLGPTDAALYMVVQIAGAMLGTLLQWIRTNGQIDGAQPSPFHDSPFYDVYVCADGGFTQKFKGTWTDEDPVVKLVFPNSDVGLADDTMVCTMSRDGDEDVLHCPLDNEISFEARPIRR